MARGKAALVNVKILLLAAAPTPGSASWVAIRALTRPVPGDAVLQVVNMRDTAIVGHRNFAIALRA
jgi:hypothetical protein